MDDVEAELKLPRQIFVWVNPRTTFLLQLVAVAAVSAVKVVVIIVIYT